MSGLLVSPGPPSSSWCQQRTLEAYSQGDAALTVKPGLNQALHTADTVFTIDTKFEFVRRAKNMQPSTEKPAQKEEALQMVWDTPTNEFAPPEHSIIRE